MSAVCKTNKKALLIADPGASEGLDYLIAWGFNYYNIGYKTGELVEQCLKGATPGDIGSIVLQDPSDFEMVLNLDTANDLGITFSPDVLAMAAATVENGIKTEK
jgi:putative ABC transport system substrate-binding protein